MELSAEGVNNILGVVDFELWVNNPGVAPVAPDFETTESLEAASLALEYISLGGESSPANKDDYLNWYSNLRVVFHTTLLDNIADVTEAILTQIDADYDVTNDVNPEVKQRWYPLGLTLKYDPVYTPANTWISSMGRSKYLDPVYQALEDSGQHDLAVQWDDANKDFYHPVAQTSIEAILYPADPTIEEVCDGCYTALKDSLYYLQ
jgi:leukotriene-A4 hydrolase